LSLQLPEIGNFSQQFLIHDLHFPATWCNDFPANHPETEVMQTESDYT